MLVHLLILNYNGRHLLQQCLPTVVAAAAASRHRCSVAVIDNDSTDDSVAWLCEHWPEVYVIPHANRGLCSFNDVAARLPGQVAILLNNDIKLAVDAVDPLVEPLRETAPAGQPRRFMTAPMCFNFDGTQYEGAKTAVRWRFGLVQATALFPGHDDVTDVPGLTASSGAVLAVDRQLFSELGGFDPLYLPGRLEDLDFAFRGYQAGHVAQYVPASVAYHLGMGTFGPVFGRDGCDRLALRNTLLFQWKNLRHPWHRLRHAGGLLLRLGVELLQAPRRPAEHRWPVWRAVREALRRWRSHRVGDIAGPTSLDHERTFFQRFHPHQLLDEGREQAGAARCRTPRNAAPIDPQPLQCQER